MTNIEVLISTLKAAEETRKNAFDALQSAMIAALPYQAGSVVEAEQYGKMVRCQITKLYIESHWRDGFIVCGSAYPFKKNGQIAAIGEINLRYANKINPVSEAVPETEKVLA